MGVEEKVDILGSDGNGPNLSNHGFIKTLPTPNRMMKLASVVERLAVENWPETHFMAVMTVMIRVSN